MVAQGMFSLIKMAFSLVVLSALAYCAFFVDLGGKPLAGHVSDIWSAPAVQEKLDTLKDKAKQHLEERLVEAAADAAAKVTGQGVPQEQVSDADREALSNMIGRAAGKKTP